MSRTTMLEPLNNLRPPSVESGTLWYLGSLASLGALGAFVRLLGDEDKAVTVRALLAYFFSGIVAGLCVVFLFSSQLGFSWTSLGVSGLAGFGAMDLLALGARLVGGMMRRLMGTTTTDKKKGKTDE